MRRVFAHRWVRRSFVLLLGAATIATAWTGAAVASDRRAHERKIDAARAKQRIESLYLQHVNAIARDVYNVVQPYHQVLDAVADDPTTIYSARDAFAGQEAVKQLTPLMSKLHALSPPPAMRTHQAALEKALAGYSADLAAVRGKSSMTNPEKLYDAITDTFDFVLDGDDMHWRNALQDTFALHLQGLPKTPFSGGSAPPSTLTWVFHADHTCAVGLHRLDPTLQRVHSSGATAADLATAGRTLLDTTAKLRRLALPAAQAAQLQGQIIDRLRVVDAEGRALMAVTRAAKSHSQAAAMEALRKFLAAGLEVRPLVRGFKSQDAIACENLFGSFEAPGTRPAPRTVNT